MKKWIFTLLIGVVLGGLTQAQTVLFDPADYADSTLPAGWSLDTIDGETYMMVIVDGWSSSLDIPAIDSWEGTGVYCTYRYALGDTSIAAGLTLADINAGVKLGSSVNQKPASWDPTQMVDSEAAMGQAPATGEFTLSAGAIDTSLKEMHYIQVSGQETVSWGATKADTVWFSKIVTYDASVLFDPASYPVDQLPAGMEIVDVSGTPMLKVTVNAWDNFLNLVPSFGMGANNRINFQGKAEQGTSSYPVDQFNLWTKGIATDDSEVWASGAAATADVSAFGADAKKDVTVKQLQFTAQETTDWGTADGAILYIGKITVETKADEYVDPRVIYEAISTGGETIELDGIQKEDIWLDANEDVADQKVSLKEDGGPYPVSTDDNSAFWYATWDSENLYLFVDITDDVVVPMPSTSDQVWMNDGIEVFVDMLDRRIVEKRITGEQHQFRWNVDRADADTSALGGYPSDFGGISGSSGFTFEIALPWKGIAKGAVADEEIDAYVAENIKEGKTIAFELSIIDNDDPAGDGRQSILNWSNDTGEDQAYNVSEYYGQIKLTGASSSVKKANSLTANVYPNPVSGMLNVELEGMTSIAVYNLTGQKVMDLDVEGNATSINMSTLSTGMYVLEVQSTQGVAVQKVTVK